MATSSSSILARRCGGHEILEEKYHWLYILKALENPWSRANPEGVLILSFAENKLSFDIFHVTTSHLTQ